MRTVRNRKRVEKIEASLNPSELVASWIEELTQFDALEGYVTWAIEDDSNRLSLSRMLEQIKEGIENRSGDHDETASKKLVRKRSSEVVFLHRLVVGTNQHVNDLLVSNEPLVAAITSSIVLAGRDMLFRRVLFDVWRSFADAPYPLDSETAAAVLAALENNVAAFDDLADSEIPAWVSDHFSGQTVNDEEFERACDAVKGAVQDLCHTGLIKRGLRVRLGSSVAEFLAQPALIDGEWIDRLAVEFAEFAALLQEKGIELQASGDVHLLAPLQPCRRKASSAGEGAEILGKDEIAAVRKEASVHLARFVGRTKEIKGRPYVRLDDYRAWKARKPKGDLEVVEGVVTASWNSWVDASGGDGGPNLAGIRVSKLESDLGQDDIVSPENWESRQRRRSAVASTVSGWMIGKAAAFDEGPGSCSVRPSEIEHLVRGCRVRLRALLTDVRATVIAIEQIAARHFQGGRILFKSYADRLKKLTNEAACCLASYNELVDYIDASRESMVFGLGKASSVDRIDAGLTEQEAQENAAIIVRRLVGLAKAGMRLFFAEDEAALQAVRAILKGV